MRIWTISDLHLTQRDALDLIKPDRFPEADVCVIAGDVCDRINLAVNWVGKVIRPHMPVIFVPGNHEFYASTLDGTRRNATMLCAALGVTLLDDAAVTIDGIRFVGGTLWTDFKLNGASGDDVARSMTEVRVSMADYGETSVLDFDTYRQMRPDDTLRQHEGTRAFLTEEFEREPDLPTVVVTHHAPHRGSIHANMPAIRSLRPSSRTWLPRSTAGGLLRGSTATSIRASTTGQAQRGSYAIRKDTGWRTPSSNP